MARVTFKKGAKVARIEKKLDNPARALKQIGIMMVAESQRAFRVQRFGETRWRPRASVNVMGIIADFKQGRKAPPQRRFENRPALRDTGRLSASISFRRIGQNAVEVGTNLDYASIHQEGGIAQSEIITKDVQRNLWNWLKKQSLGMRRKLGWLLNSKFTGTRLEQKVPARPFVGVTKSTRRDIRRIVGVEIMEVS